MYPGPNSGALDAARQKSLLDRPRQGTSIRKIIHQGREKEKVEVAFDLFLSRPEIGGNGPIPGLVKKEMREVLALVLL